MEDKKKIIREEVLRKLSKISEIERSLISKKLSKKILESDVFRKSKCVAITLSQNMEWDTSIIINEAWKQNKRVCIPKTEKNGIMNFFEYNRFTKLEKSFFGILEPVESLLVTKDEIDLIIVPGLAFDKEGYRIGFGGGYYDRYLVDYKGITLSMISREQLYESIPKEEHDISVGILEME